MNWGRTFVVATAILGSGCCATALAGDFGTAPSIGSMQVTPRNRHKDKPKPTNIKISAPTVDIDAGAITGLTSFAVHPHSHSADSAAGGKGPMMEPLRALNTPAPVYPVDEYRDGVSATVKVAFTVKADGTTANIQILSKDAPTPFQSATRAAVAQWTFHPYSIGGQAQSQRVEQTIAFTPPHIAAAPQSHQEQKPQDSGRGPSVPTRPAPVPVHLVPPEYPAAAARRHAHGYVVVAFTVDADGHTSDIQVVESQPRRTFDSAARRAVEQWRFKPYRVDGQPATTRVKQKIQFNMGG